MASKVHSGNGTTAQTPETEIPLINTLKTEWTVGVEVKEATEKEAKPVADHPTVTEVAPAEETTIPTKKRPRGPGDCVFRVIVPVLKAESIIGRNGDIIKKMCEDTKANIRVLKGPVSHPNRIVEISGKEDIDAPVSPAMDAVIRVFKVINGFPENESDVLPSFPFCSIRLLLTSMQATILIEMQGSLLKTIQENTGCFIRSLSCEEVSKLSAKSDDRVVNLKGEGLKVLQVLEAVLGHLCMFLVDPSTLPLFEKTAKTVPGPVRRHKKRGRPTLLPPHIAAEAPVEPQKEPIVKVPPELLQLQPESELMAIETKAEVPGDCVFWVIVPMLKVESIFGRNGDFIKKICEETKANIRALEVRDPNLIVEISGKEEMEAPLSPAMDAVIRVFKHVNGFPENESHGFGLTSIPCSSVQLLLTSMQATSLIEKQGFLINKIQENTGCSVRILSTDEVSTFSANSDDRVVDLHGEPLKVLQALEALLGHLRMFLVNHSIIPYFEKTVAQTIQISLIDVIDIMGVGRTNIVCMSGATFIVQENKTTQKKISVEIRGTTSQVQSAQQLIQAKTGPGRAWFGPVKQAVDHVTQTMQIPFNDAVGIIRVEGTNFGCTSGASFTIQECNISRQRIAVEIRGTKTQVQTAQQLIQAKTRLSRVSFGKVRPVVDQALTGPRPASRCCSTLPPPHVATSPSGEASLESQAAVPLVLSSTATETPLEPQKEPMVEVPPATAFVTVETKTDVPLELPEVQPANALEAIETNKPEEPVVQPANALEAKTVPDGALTAFSTPSPTFGFGLFGSSSSSTSSGTSLFGSTCTFGSGSIFGTSSTSVISWPSSSGLFGSSSQTPSFMTPTTTTNTATKTLSFPAFGMENIKESEQNKRKKCHHNLTRGSSGVEPQAAVPPELPQVQPASELMAIETKRSMSVFEEETLGVLKMIADKMYKQEPPPKPTFEDCEKKLNELGWPKDDPLHEVAFAIFCDKNDKYRECWMKLHPERCANWVRMIGRSKNFL